MFEEDLPDKVPLSPASGKVIAELLEDLNRYNFSQMPQDVVGQVFEKLIPYPERHSLGQYFTREDLVDFINAFCVRSVEDKILDPTCGTGTFLIRAYEKLKHLGERDHKKLLSRLWGIDVAKFPAALATINLYKQDLADYANFPRIISQDFFDTGPGDMFKFPPPKPTGDPGFMIEESLPLFDGAVGNFPYIRQELIEKRLKGYKEKLQKVLEEDWLEEYRELFDKKGSLHLSGQADIYAYLFFHLPKFIKEDGGRMGIVTSNAWLDVAYGYELQRFFLKNFKIIAILESRCEPWFEDAAINTIVTILERCKNAEERDRHLVKFVKVKKRLKDLIPYDIKAETTRRFYYLDGLIHKIEDAGKEYIKLEATKVINTLKGIKTYEDEDFRIRVIRQGELLKEIEKTGKTTKWGKYLRAPEVYFEIMDKCRDMLVPLEEVSNIRFGIKTGINEFFHLTKDKIKSWGIEKEFLAPIVTSLKEVEEPVINPRKLRFLLFNCHKSKDELRRNRKGGALAYIKFGEEQKTKGRGRVGRSGLGYPDVPSVQGRTYWYDVGDREPGDLVINRFTGERFFFPVNKHKVMISDTFFEVKFKESNSTTLYQAILNSTLTYLFAELTGRITWTQGVLYFYGPEITELLIPNLINIPKGLHSKIIKAFNKILSRPLESISEEIQKKDRRNLDSLLLKAMGLAPEKYLKPIYFGLCELVKERTELVKIGQKTRQTRTERDIEKIKEELLRDILPEGPKKFPEEFLPHVKKEDFQEISIPASPLRLGRYFFGRQEIVSEDGFSYQARSVEEAKFIIYSQRPDTFVARVPKNDIAIQKAVVEYERYLKELKDEFFAAFFQRIHDHKQADALTQVVFQEQGLPEIVGS
ncbi:MAG TPA: HsdM family class I SAM-dependent methyltransferase [Candidatus Hypogeohydataceae bacterium YC38]